MLVPALAPPPYDPTGVGRTDRYDDESGRGRLVFQTCGEAAAGPLVAGIAVVLGTFAVGEQTSWRFTGWGADPVGHYSLAYWFAHHWTLPAADDLTWHIIADNPPAANIAAALVGHVVGSTFMGLYLAAAAAVVLVWCALAALLALLPAPRRWLALGGLTLLLAFNTSAGPLRLNVHGFEIVLNYFFAQIVAQAVVWWLVWFAVLRRLKGRSAVSTAVPIAIVAVLSTYVHALGSVESSCSSAASRPRSWWRGGVTAAATSVLWRRRSGFSSRRRSRSPSCRRSARNGALRGTTATSRWTTSPGRPTM